MSELAILPEYPQTAPQGAADDDVRGAAALPATAAAARLGGQMKHLREFSLVDLDASSPAPFSAESADSNGRSYASGA